MAGLDLAAGRGTTALALLALASGGRPRLMGMPRLAATDDDILTVLYESGASIVAVDAPLTLPMAVMTALRSEQGEPSSDAALLGSPYTRAAERDAVWSEVGVRPLPVSFLGGLTLRALVLRARMREQLPNLRVVETFPSAVLRILHIRERRDPRAAAQASSTISLATSQNPRQERARKTALPTRLATQRGLTRWIDGLPVPAEAHGAEDEVLGADALDALAAALTAVAVAEDTGRLVGTAEEGQIVLPDAPAFARTLGVSLAIER